MFLREWYNVNRCCPHEATFVVTTSYRVQRPHDTFTTAFVKTASVYVGKLQMTLQPRIMTSAITQGLLGPSHFTWVYITT